jgi:hypothetical protein
MIEKLFALKLPPGLYNTGTTYQSKGRWHAGNCVRFTNGAIQPIGGWVPRALSGATISGTPNAAISWQINDGTQYLVIGTSTGLYAVTGANVVYNITPIYDGPASPWVWQLETFGSYLIGVINETNNGTQTRANVVSWTGDLATIAAGLAYPYRQVPRFPFGCVVTPERFLVVLRGGDPDPAFGGDPYPVTPGRIS